MTTWWQCSLSANPFCVHPLHFVTDSCDCIMAQVKNSAHPLVIFHQLISRNANDNAFHKFVRCAVRGARREKNFSDTENLCIGQALRDCLKHCFPVCPGLADLLPPATPPTTASWRTMYSATHAHLATQRSENDADDWSIATCMCVCVPFVGCLCGRAKAAAAPPQHLHHHFHRGTSCMPCTGTFGGYGCDGGWTEGAFVFLSTGVGLAFSNFTWTAAVACPTSCGQGLCSCSLWFGAEVDVLGFSWPCTQVQGRGVMSTGTWPP